MLIMNQKYTIFTLMYVKCDIVTKQSLFYLYLSTKMLCFSLNDIASSFLLNIFHSRYPGMQRYIYIYILHFLSIIFVFQFSGNDWTNEGKWYPKVNFIGNV